MTAPTILESGWLADTPEGDTIIRGFLLNQAQLNVSLATATGGRSDATDEVALSDGLSAVPYLNQAVLRRPVLSTSDPLLDEIDGYFAPARSPATVLSVWPTPDLTERGWQLIGHPVFLVRPGSTRTDTNAPADGVDVRLATTADDLAVAERIAIEGYPLEEAQGAPPNSILGVDLLDGPVRFRVGYHHGRAVSVASSHVAYGLVNLCLAATLPDERRNGVWRALVNARVQDGPNLPVVAFTSDFSRPGLQRMDFLPITRFTLWLRPGEPVARG